MQAVGEGYTEAYLPIVERRKAMNWGERERNFQLYRRGRYVEFNPDVDAAAGALGIRLAAGRWQSGGRSQRFYSGA